MLYTARKPEDRRLLPSCVVRWGQALIYEVNIGFQGVRATKIRMAHEEGRVTVTAVLRSG
jgi:hypothetical protein